MSTIMRRWDTFNIQVLAGKASHSVSFFLFFHSIVHSLWSNVWTWVFSSSCSPICYWFDIWTCNCSQECVWSNVWTCSPLFFHVITHRYAFCLLAENKPRWRDSTRTWSRVQEKEQQWKQRITKRWKWLNRLHRI